MARTLTFTPHGWNDYVYWQTQDKKTLKRINTLIASIQRDPFKGPGDPEPLKANLSGFWSRRIGLKNRLVYAVHDNTLVILQCRFHYTDT